MGKKIKKLDSKANSAAPSMINFIERSKKESKSKENNNENNISKKDLPKTIKRYKKIKRKRPKGRKYKLLKIIFINRRIHEITMQNRIKRFLLKLYEKKLDILTEEYNDLILSKYNYLRKKIFLR